jgi:hypothetical protein
MNWINFAVFSLLLITIFYLLYLVIKNRIQRNRLYSLGAFLNNELFEANGKIQELEKQIEQLNLKESDGFVKFLSSSRDWAFEYIEEVQKALTEFDEEVTPQLEWANTHGRLAGETVHTNTINTISEAYKKLKTVLPTNTETPNN